MSNLPSPNEPNRLSPWFLLPLVLGGLTTWITIAQIAAQHIWQAIGVGISSLLIFLVTSILAGVWQQLVNNWGKRIADWINSPHNYQKRYCQWFISNHNKLDIGGVRIYNTPLPLLEHIFVELNFSKKPPYEISSAAFSLRETPPASRHPISYYIEHTPNHLVLLGRPGTGKTITLRELGVSLINRKKQRRLPKDQYQLPFLLSLRDYGNIIKEQDQFTLVNAIEASLSKWNRAAPPEWIASRLKKGHCLILLDGLDEVPDAEARQAIAKWVEQQMVTYDQNNRFILTSRPQGYHGNPISGKVIVLEVQGFSSNQIKEFIKKWYYAEEKEANRSGGALGTSERAQHKADSFHSRLQATPTVFDLARNPLLLTMSIMVDRHRGVLPGSRGELYKEIFEVFLGGRQRAKGLRVALSPEQNQMVLQHLAFYMMDEETEELTPAVAESVIEEPLKSANTQLAPQEFLKTIEDSNIWVRQGSGVFGFAHLSFQEYLAAMHVKEKNLEQILVERIGVSWWHETIILYCNRADASPIIKECLTRKPLSVSALGLALECEEAASRSSFIGDPSVRTLFNSILIQGIEDANTEIRSMVTEALLAQRIKKMLPLDDSDTAYATTSLITCAEYQLFLDKQPQEMYHQPDHWVNLRFPPGQGRAPVLGVRPSDALAFCTWLTERDQESWRYRLPQKNEVEKVEKLGDKDGNLTVGAGYWIDEGREFIWIKNTLLLSTDTRQKQLHDSWLDDKKRVEDPKTLAMIPLSDKGRLLLSNHVVIAHNLIAAHNIHHNLVDVLTSIRERILNHDSALNADCDRAHDKTSDLQVQLTEKRKDRADFERRLEKRHRLEISLATAHVKQIDLQNELNTIDNDAKVLQDNLAELDRQIKGLQKQLARTFRNQRKSLLQSRIATTVRLKDSLQIQLNIKREEKEHLTSQSNEALASVTQLQRQLNTIELNKQINDAREQESVLNKQVNEARGQESILKERLAHFRSQTLPFHSICNRFLRFTPTYNGNARSNALTRNHVLDFDRVLVDMDNSTEALHYLEVLVRSYVENLAESLTSYYQDADININGQNIKSHIADALKLVEHLKQFISGNNAQKLGSYLKAYFRRLSQNRPFGKKEWSPINLYTRLYIRYFAEVLASYLLYWSWHELSLDAEQPLYLQQIIDQRIIDTYFDVYTSFAILEERISGNLAAMEGILIVREHREEN